MISLKELVRIWENLRVKWYYPQIPQPEIRTAKDGKEKIYFNNYEITIDEEEIPEDKELQKIYIENILEHEICHYIYCPYNMETVAGLILESRKALSEVYETEKIDPRQVNLCVNFFTDVVVENFRFKKNKEQNDKIILFHKNKIGKTEKISKIYKIFVSTLGELWKYKFIEKDPETEKFINKISTILKETGNRRNWNTQCYLTSIALSPFLENEPYLDEQEKKSSISFFLKSLDTVFRIGKGSKETNKNSNKKRVLEISEPQEKYKYIEEIEKRKKETPLVKAAEESDLKEFRELVKILGITDNEQEALKKWYRDQAYGIVISPVERYDKTEYPTAPTKWRVTDPPSDLDLIYSKSIAPVIIPGVTAFKREKEIGAIHPVDKKMPDLLIVVDSSYSMGGHLKGTRTFYAMIAAFKAYRYALNKGANVAVINFSGNEGNPLYRVTKYTKNPELIEDALIHYYGLYTCIPGKEIERLSQKEDVLIMLLTDAEIQNFESQIEYIENAAAKNYFVLICTSDTNTTMTTNAADTTDTKNKKNATLEKLKKLGKVYFIKKPEDLIGLTIEATKKIYDT